MRDAPRLHLLFGYRGQAAAGARWSLRCATPERRPRHHHDLLGAGIVVGVSRCQWPRLWSDARARNIREAAACFTADTRALIVDRARHGHADRRGLRAACCAHCAGDDGIRSAADRRAHVRALLRHDVVRHATGRGGCVRCSEHRQDGPMRTGLESMRFGWVAYIVPFLFVYSPTLIMVGDPVHIVVDFVTAVAGIWLMSMGFVGYSMRSIGWIERVVFMVIGGLSLGADRAVPAGDLLQRHRRSSRRRLDRARIRAPFAQAAGGGHRRGSRSREKGIGRKFGDWSEWQDLNLRPPAPEAGALPGCATLRFRVLLAAHFRCFKARSSAATFFNAEPICGLRADAQHRSLHGDSSASDWGVAKW